MKLKEYITIQNNVDASTSTPLDNSRIDKSKPGIRFEVQKSCILPDMFHKKKKKKKPMTRKEESFVTRGSCISSAS